MLQRMIKTRCISEEKKGERENSINSALYKISKDNYQLGDKNTPLRKISGTEVCLLSPTILMLIQHICHATMEKNVHRREIT